METSFIAVGVEALDRFKRGLMMFGACRMIMSEGRKFSALDVEQAQHF